MISIITKKIVGQSSDTPMMVGITSYSTSRRRFRSASFQSSRNCSASAVASPGDAQRHGIGRQMPYSSQADDSHCRRSTGTTDQAPVSCGRSSMSRTQSRLPSWPLPPRRDGCGASASDMFAQS